jgi:GTP-binding protein EngB required for normal cell division
MSGLTDPQRRHILQVFQAIHRRMEELEALLVQSANRTPFSNLTVDVSPTEAKVIRDYFARIRTAMLAHLRSLEIPLEVRRSRLRWTLQANLLHLQVTVDDFSPESLAGYGPVDDMARAMIIAIQEDLARLFDQVKLFVQQEAGHDLAGRLARLDAESADATPLATLEHIITRWRLVEFRPMLEWIVRRLEDPQFEIAVFGRVSSGKSSLLNHLTGWDVLPVGVTPVTAVLTRLTAGPAPEAVVSFAESEPRRIPVERLQDFASEEGNPGNRKHVTEVLVRLPSSRLRDGVVFVDTPGVGSLALEGAAETLAYLPRSDLGVLLVDAATSLNQDDLALLRSLYVAGVPAMVVLSKADLLSESDRERVAGYTRGQIQAQLGLDLPVRPVSSVEAEESLLTAWFEQEVRPLLERHRALAEASLRRKIAHLRESVGATLQTLLDRCNRTGWSDAAQSRLRAARARLDEADKSIRTTRERVLHWSDERADLTWIAVQRAARRMLQHDQPSGQDGNGGVAATVLELLAERGQAARDCAEDLQRELARALDGIDSTDPNAEADRINVGELRLPGLPVPEVTTIASASRIWRPWWVRIAPSWMAPAVCRRIENDLGGEIQETLNFEDRRLQGWLKDAVNQIVAQYESRAASIREHMRRLGEEPQDLDGTADRERLEADLRSLRSSDLSPREEVSSSVSVEASSASKAKSTLTRSIRELN